MGTNGGLVNQSGSLEGVTRVGLWLAFTGRDSWKYISINSDSEQLSTVCHIDPKNTHPHLCQGYKQPNRRLMIGCTTLENSVPSTPCLSCFETGSQPPAIQNCWVKVQQVLSLNGCGTPSYPYTVHRQNVCLDANVCINNNYIIIYIYVCVCTYLLLILRMCIYIYIHVYMYVYTCLGLKIELCIYIYIHMCVCAYTSLINY